MINKVLVFPIIETEAHEGFKSREQIESPEINASDIRGAIEEAEQINRIIKYMNVSDLERVNDLFVNSILPQAEKAFITKDALFDSGVKLAALYLKGVEDGKRAERLAKSVKASYR